MLRALFEMVGRGAPAPAFTEAEWQELLAFADRTQLTLYLRGAPGLPPWFSDEVETRYAKNARRRCRLHAAYVEAAHALGVDGIDFVLLKSFTHETGFGTDGSARVQYDLDLLTLPCDVARARKVFERLGYAPHGKRSLSEEHGRPLVRPSDWTWRGDYYDPEMPIPLELHESPWIAKHDRIHTTGIEEFWSRRCFIDVNGLRIPAFAEVDRLAFAALHGLRHILRHDVKPAHILELSRFLEARAGDAHFWDQWRNLHPPELQALQTVGFRFAHEWFGCEVTWSAQPASVDEWFRSFTWSPVANLTAPNKDTIWLHLALIANRWDRIRVFCDRIVPMRMPHEEFFGRLRYHALALAPTLASGLRWRRQAASTAAEISDWKRGNV